jgi:hypothetical protein
MKIAAKMTPRSAHEKSLSSDKFPNLKTKYMVAGIAARVMTQVAIREIMNNGPPMG